MRRGSDKYSPAASGLGRGLALTALILAALASAGGCAARPRPSPDEATIAHPPPWRGPAAKLSERGFTAAQLNSFFSSPDLVYSNSPMAAKLKELHGLSFNAEMTREIQEKLFQLGYEIHIDGRSGSGTKAAINRFQAEHGHTPTGEVSRAALAQIDRAMKKKPGDLRPLSSYRPPPPRPPSRATTYNQFTNPKALGEISAFFKADQALFSEFTRRHGIPGEVAAAIMWVETGYGRNFGRQKAASMLASMAAAASDFSVVAPAVAELGRDRETLAFLRKLAIERGNWALDELAALMRHAYDNGLDPNSFPGSIYGAIGWGQFMPTNILKYGVDGDGDGRVDLFNKADAVHSIGVFLKAHGWSGPNMTEDARRSVILKYNRSGIYANTVLYVADHLAGRRQRKEQDFAPPSGL
jgi:membrane-bound lytic murein transglycosylase B